MTVTSAASELTAGGAHRTVECPCKQDFCAAIPQAHPGAIDIPANKDSGRDSAQSAINRGNLRLLAPGASHSVPQQPAILAAPAQPAPLGTEPPARTGEIMVGRNGWNSPLPTATVKPSFNIEDKGEVAVVDIKARKVLTRYKLCRTAKKTFRPWRSIRKPAWMVAACAKQHPAVALKGQRMAPSSPRPAIKGAIRTRPIFDPQA